MKEVTGALLDFAQNTRYEDIPDEVIHEMKRILVDGLGSALGGLTSDKGKFGIGFARRVGGTPESTIIGIGLKAAAPVAAFANSELLNGLDLDPIPHIPPIVLPSVLAVAEAQNAGAREFLRALTLGHDIALRLNRVFGMHMMNSLTKYNKVPDINGNSNEHMLGAAVANALLMKLDRTQIAHALGICAYLCPLPSCTDWETTNPKSMIKYAPVSWCAQGAVQAAMMAADGYTGNARTLDNEFGFPAMYMRDVQWDPDTVLNGLGEVWGVLNTMYKPYPCCRFLHASLDVFYKLKKEYGFSGADIVEVGCNTGPFTAHPDQYAINNQVDAQFSGPYNIAVAAYDFAPGPQWQDSQRLKDPKILELAHKVKMIIAPEYAEYKKTMPYSFYARVEVDLKDGRSISDYTLTPRGGNYGDCRLSDEELNERFRNCATVILPGHKIDKALDIIWNLDQYETLEPLMEAITL